jgi:general secretion pathway protein A
VALGGAALPDFSRVAQDAVGRLDKLLAAPSQPAAPAAPAAPKAQAVYAPELAGVVDAAPQAQGQAEAPAAPAGPVVPKAPSVVHAPAPSRLAQEGLGASLALSAAALPAQAPVQAPVQMSAQTPAGARLGRVVPADAASPAESLAEKAVADAPALETLGQTTARPGWAATRLAARVYGNGGRAVMTRLAKANPGVDLERLRAGEAVVFPAIAAEPLPAGACMVRVASCDSLDKGFAFIARHPGADPALALYCVHVPGLGLRFDVVAAALYANRLSAETALSELPAELAAKAEVVEGYPAGSTAFTDLGPWNGRRSRPKLAGAPRAQARQVADSETAVREAQP